MLTQQTLASNKKVFVPPLASAHKDTAKKSKKEDTIGGQGKDFRSKLKAKQTLKRTPFHKNKEHDSSEESEESDEEAAVKTPRPKHTKEETKISKSKRKNAGTGLKERSS